jgi:DNA polymerase-3 subunit gamma/tau
MDVVEIDAASESGVEDVREKIVEAVEYRPALFERKIFIIDEVHDLSSKAFDALLKTIEEPPSHIVFILATTEYSKVPPTIRSRCQKFEFHRGSMADLTSRLQLVAEGEGAEVEPAALGAIAKMADGGFRDALTLLEQAILTAEGKVTLEHVYNQLGLIGDDVSDRLLKSMAEGDEAAIMALTEEVYRKGRDPRSIIEALLYRLSDLTRSFYQVGDGGDPAATASLRSIAAGFGPETLLRFRTSLAEAHRVIRDISLPRIWFEAELMRISRMLLSPSPSAAAPSPARSAPTPQEPVRAASPPSEPRPAPERAAPTPAPAGGSQAETWWLQVVAELSTMSPLASRTLQGSKVIAEQGKVVTIGFKGITVYDSFMGKPKLQGAVRDAWAKRAGPELALNFAGDGASLNLTPASEVTAVELPLEGQRLVDAAKDIFLPDRT